ncbi:hypothetical protein [Bradyrhizobium sp. 173]|nr:hypothetical protein [Bradyrhizobium sp. 173]
MTNVPTLEERRAIEAQVSPQRRAEIEGLVKSLAPVIGPISSWQQSRR